MSIIRIIQVPEHHNIVNSTISLMPLALLIDV